MGAEEMKRLLVNDVMTCIPGTRTFWHDLEEWFLMKFIGGDYKDLAKIADANASIVDDPGDGKPSIFTTLIIRNASYFGPLKSSQPELKENCPKCGGSTIRCGNHGESGEPSISYREGIPTISLLQDIMEEGPGREMQKEVWKTSRYIVFNSEFTRSKYDTGEELCGHGTTPVIPLPVDFDLFQPGNPMGLQQELSLPDNCVLWVGASEGAAGQVKGVDIFLKIVRQNPDINFVAVFKDKWLDYCPPNMRMFTRQSHAELVKIIGACRVGLCTSRTEWQHLAGIEMGACGLPVVVPEVGTYFGRGKSTDFFKVGMLVTDPTVQSYTKYIRQVLKEPGDPQSIRTYWQKEFSKPVVKAKWEELVKEVEGGSSPKN